MTKPLTIEQIKQRIDGLTAKLRWTHLAPHLADKYREELERLRKELKRLGG